MTREEEIKKAAFEAYPEKIGYDSIIEKFKDYNLHDRMKFIEGAKWADEHPRKGLWDSEKVVEWIGGHIYIGFGFEDRMNGLRKAMEE